MSTLVFQTHRAARIDDYAAATGATSDIARHWGHRAAVFAPINVEGRLWGVMIAGSLFEPLPTDAEARLGVFTELVGGYPSGGSAPRTVKVGDTVRRPRACGQLGSRPTWPSVIRRARRRRAFATTSQCAF